MTEPIYSGTLTGNIYETIQEQHIIDLPGEMVDSDVEVFLYDNEVEIHAEYPDSNASHQESYLESDLATSFEELEETLEDLESENTEDSNLIGCLRRAYNYL